MHTHAHAHAQSLQSYTATVAEVLRTEVVKVQYYHLINEAPVRRKSQEGDMAMPFSIMVHYVFARFPPVPEPIFMVV